MYAVGCNDTKERNNKMKPTVFKGSAVALVTPMKEDGSVNYDELARLLCFQLQNQTDAIVATGTTGESATLTDEEHIEIIRFCVEQVNGKIPVIAGVGSNNTAHAVRLSQQAQSVGADALLHVTPYYNKTSQKGLYLHFKACADAVGIPIILYNVPTRTGVNILPETYLKLSQVRNIVATKEASGNFSQMAKILSLCGDNLAIYSGNDDQITSALAIGAKGVISVLANIAPHETHEICRSYFEGDTSRSDSLQLQYLELIEALFCDVNPIPVKQALSFMGYHTGRCRLPLCDMDEAQAEQLLVCLQKYGLAERRSQSGTVTVKRPEHTLLWRKNH